jgi:hypothetical protein
MLSLEIKGRVSRGVKVYTAIMAEPEDFVFGVALKVWARLTPLLLADLRKTPGPVKYPIQWKTARQRRAFFATNGFGRGIPTKRTGALGNGWATQTVGTVNTLGLYAQNRVPYRVFVTGFAQQPFHTITGWQPDAQTLNKWSGQFMAETDQAITKAFYEVGR